MKIIWQVYIRIEASGSNNRKYRLVTGGLQFFADAQDRKHGQNVSYNIPDLEETFNDAWKEESNNTREDFQNK